MQFQAAVSFLSTVSSSAIYYAPITSTREGVLCPKSGELTAMVMEGCMIGSEKLHLMVVAQIWKGVMQCLWLILFEGVQTFAQISTACLR